MAAGAEVVDGGFSAEAFAVCSCPSIECIDVGVRAGATAGGGVSAVFLVAAVVV